MQSLGFLRFMRKVPLFGTRPEFPHLETLIENQAGRPHNIYQILKYVIPASVLVFGGASAGFAIWQNANPLGVGLGIFGTLVIAAGAGFLFHHLDKTIPDDSRRLRQLANKLVGRHLGWGNLVGSEPAVHPRVGEVLDEAAGIYLRHVGAGDKPPSPTRSVARVKAYRALEAGMARLLELAEPERAAQQEQILTAGWAEPLLAEMQALDKQLVEQTKRSAAERLIQDDPALEALREARHSLQSLETAEDELHAQLWLGDEPPEKA